MLPLCQTVLAATGAVGEAADQGFDQRLLQPARSIRIGENFWVRFREIPGCRNRWSFAIAEGGGVINIVSRGGVRSAPAIVSPSAAISSTGSDMLP